jgi:2-oxoglutarate ferredoxin oxidoreductase subunit gamma
MQQEIVFSGFGGQGALFAGQLLAYAAMDEDKHVTWIPSYGPEMRGGTAHCIVIISDEEIGAPTTRTPSAAIVLNIPSLDKYEPLMKPNGYLIINRSLIPRATTRTDITVIDVPANDLAAELGNVKMANVVALGALVAASQIVKVESVFQALDIHMPAKRKRLTRPNQAALMKGVEVVHQQLAKK